MVAHLVERHYDGDLAEAVRLAAAELEGHFAFVVIHHDHPDLLVGARHSARSSSASARTRCSSPRMPPRSCARRARQFPDDGDVVAITPEGATFVRRDGRPIEHDPIVLDWDDEGAEKGGYETFMLKEIYEQPEAVAETIGDRVRHGRLELEGLGLCDDELRDLRRIVILACGTAYHAGVVGRYVLEEWARIPVEPDIASEWLYRNPVIGPDTLVIGISQSGETRDTIAAMQLAREKGAHTLAITNMMGTQITREVDSVLYTRCGLEVGVAASKTFTAQVALFYLVALKLAQVRETLPPGEIESLLDEVHALPEQDGHVPRRRPPDRGDRRAPLRQAVLPLPRPPHRPARLPRGRAEAEGDLVHPDRGLLGRRDEARADRAARRAHARGRASRPTRTSTTRSSRTSRRRGRAARR